MLFSCLYASLKFFSFFLQFGAKAEMTLALTVKIR